MTAKAPRYHSEEMLPASGLELDTFDELYAQEVAQNNAIYGHHRTTFYHVFRYEGEGNVHYVERKKIAPAGDSLLIINRNVLHRYAEQKCSGNMVLFSGAFFGNTPETISFLSTTPLLQRSHALIPLRSQPLRAAVDYYIALMRKLLPHLKADRLAPHVVLHNCLHNLLLTAEREHRLCSPGAAAIPGGNAHMQQFKTLLDAHYATEKQVQFYAEKLHLPAKKLSQIATAAHGISAKAYINEKMLQEAIWMLKNTTLNQGEIAHKLGLDFTYFVKFFRRHTHLTPAKYRQKLSTEA